ncbi:MAG: serine hydrolase [Elusimicrobia bacterium]|nr:serine hydrolase [Elusimicrobiota bacterium]
MEERQPAPPNARSPRGGELAASGRIAPNRPGSGLRAQDILVGAVLFAVAVAYPLGFGLDWSERIDAPVIEDAPEAPSPPEAPAPSPDAVAPRPAPVAAPKPVEPPRAPAAPQAWAPDPAAAAWERMTEDLFRLAASYRGRVAIVLKDLSTGNTWTYHQDDLFPAASLIKVPVMICVFAAINDGKLALSDKIALRRQHRTGGSGSVKWLHDGTRFTVRELLYRMINESDNTATAMLLDTISFRFVQEQLPKVGLFYTEVNAEGLSIKSGRVPRENYTTAREMTMLLERIYRGEVVNRASSELMMDILRHRRATRSRLAKGLPRGWELAHKTGLLRQACHDVAVVLTPHGDYVLTVLTGHNNSYGTAKDFISRLGKVTFKYYETRGHLLAKASARRGTLAVP